MSFLMPDMPAVQKPPAIPRRSDAAVQQSAAETRRRYSGTSGGSTMTTGGFAKPDEEFSYTVASKLLGGGAV